MEVRFTEHSIHRASYKPENVNASYKPEDINAFNKVEDVNASVAELNNSEELENRERSNENSRSIIPQKVMMDLKDVQRFLYMLIGSEIKVKSDNESIGLNVNTMA